MQEIFRSTPVPMTFTDPRTGLRHEGFGFLRVLAYSADEPPQMYPGTNHPMTYPRLLSMLKAEAGGRPLIAVPTPPFQPYFSPMAIPDAVLEPLPGTSRIEWRWRFQRGVE